MVQIVLEIMERGKLNINRKLKKIVKFQLSQGRWRKVSFLPSDLTGGGGGGHSYIMDDMDVCH